MKQWLPAALFAATLALIVPALAQSTSGPLIRAKDHPMHGNAFSSALNKSSYWRGEVNRRGYDVAFDEWMQKDHPYVYATYCTTEAKKVADANKNTKEFKEFNDLLPKRADLSAKVKSIGFDAAFADWLQDHHPAKIDQSMNEKQMPRSMKM